MGYDSACTLTTDGRTYSGTARLEQKELVFRGDVRVVIPLDRIDDVHARDGRLCVSFTGRRATLEIGACAEKWANRIANPPSRLDKLGVKDGMRVAVINVPDEQLVHELASRNVAIVRGARRGLDMIFFGLSAASDLTRIATLADRITPAGAIWIIRAKGAAAQVSEASSMAAGKRAGLVDVKVVSFSETHTAEKYVIPVAKRGRRARAVSPAHE